MPREPSRNQLNGLQYVASKPKFLQNFGQPAPSRSPPPDHHGTRGGERGAGRGGREPIPERPKEGRWAGGSDGEDGGRAGRGGADDESDDEWGEVFGGGGEDGPLVVVLKEGRHLTSEEVKRERRRAAGKPSQSPPATTAEEDKPKTVDQSNETRSKPSIHRPASTSSKRKLVGQDDKAKAEAGADTESKKPKKKNKAAKGLLSFDETEGER